MELVLAVILLLLQPCLRYTIYVEGVPLSEMYMQQRALVYEEEQRMRTGGDLQLSPREELVNAFLMKHKSQRVTTSRWTNVPYPASVPFSHAKKTIEGSVEYDVIRMMPKGGNLHTHYESVVSASWMVSNLTYLPDLYSRENLLTGHMEFKFADESSNEGWSQVSYQREQSPDVERFDKKIEEQLTMSLPADTHIYPNNNEQWVEFARILGTRRALLASTQNKLTSLERIMEEHLEDGVTYVEIRISACTKDTLAEFLAGRYTELFENIGTTIGAFIREHPSFVGVKFIIAASRMISKKNAQACIEEVMQLMTKFPDLIKGFDISFHEVQGNPSLYYVDQLLYPKSVGFDMPLFLHAGEMDWTLGFDDNLIDALLLNVSRVGHGFASLKHPKILDAMLNGKLILEVNTISNQVLGLIQDMRTHPAATLIAKNLPLVISSDDGGVWGASPLSHDFYMALMGLGSVRDDLRLLKQLAINSFRYSAMTENEKDQAMAKWGHLWTTFIDDVIKKYDLS